MAITLANLNGVEKPRFGQFINEAAYAKLAFVQSGAIQVVNPAELGISNTGARIVTLPYWDIDSTTHTDLTDTNTATSAVAITAGEQIGRMLYRGRAWGATWLAKHLVGADPLQNVAAKIGEFWANVFHTTTLYTIAGLFGDDGGATTGLDGRYKDSTGSGVVTGTILREGIYMMGDQFDKIALMLCHSSVYALLDDNEDIIMVPDGLGGLYPTLRGTKIRIFVDDTMPRHNLSIPNDVGANNSAVYYFGPGAFILSDIDNYVKASETASTGSTEIHNRKAFLLHPNGVSWQSSAPTNAAGQALTPTNAQLATKANWSLEFNAQNVAIVRQDVAVA